MNTKTEYPITNAVRKADDAQWEVGRKTMELYACNRNLQSIVYHEYSDRLKCAMDMKCELKQLTKELNKLISYLGEIT